MSRNDCLVFWVATLLLTCVLYVYGQVESSESPQAGNETTLYEAPPGLEEGALQQTNLSGIGLTFINSDPFIRTQLQPEVNLGKIGLGLDIVLLYNPDAEGDEDKILVEDAERWDNLSSLLRTFRYVRYGHLYHSFYARFGALDYVTIGHGLIMSGYSNHDRRGLRLNLSNDTKNFGVETIINNLGNPTVFGGRTYIRPLQKEDESTILRRLEFGGTYLTDIDPTSGDLDEDPLVALGVDVGLPIIHNKLMRVDLYDEVAFLNTKPIADEPDGMDLTRGNALGIGLSIFQALFKVEYRTFREGFRPTIFDYTYDAAKGVIPDFLGMDADTNVDELGRGYFSLLAWRPTPMVHLLGTFEDYNTIDPKLYLGVTESGLVEKMSFRAFYVKRDIGEPDPDYPDALGSKDPAFFEDLVRLDEKSAFTVRIGYEAFSPVEVAVIREYRFRQVEKPDGNVGFEPIRMTSIEVGVNLKF
jgi:hypothetical protein